MAAVLGARAAKYRELEKAFKKDVERGVAIGLSELVLKHLTDLEHDFTTAMNVQHVPGDTLEIMMIRMKRDTANKMISKTRAKINRDLAAFIKMETTPPSEA